MPASATAATSASVSGSTQGECWGAEARIRSSTADRRAASDVLLAFASDETGSPVSSGSRLGSSDGSMAQVTAADPVDSVDSRTRLTREPAPSARSHAAWRASPSAPNRAGSGSRVSGTTQPRRIGWYCLSRW